MLVFHYVFMDFMDHERFVNILTCFLTAEIICFGRCILNMFDVLLDCVNNCAPLPNSNRCN